jgi:FixJ family two-component response regulator
MNAHEPCVFLVDDDDDVRQALTRLLCAAGYRAEAFDSAASFLASADLSRCPACLLLDLQLPDMSGLEVQCKLKSALPIIFITGHGDIPATVDAMKAGAADFLTKPVCDTVLLEAIRHALERAIQIFSYRQEMSDIQARLNRLTPREREVMALIVGGRLNKQAAGELGIAEKTIKVHRARVMEKMEANSLADLIHIADKALPGLSGLSGTTALLRSPTP